MLWPVFDRGCFMGPGEGFCHLIGMEPPPLIDFSHYRTLVLKYRQNFKVANKVGSPRDQLPYFDSAPRFFVAPLKFWYKSLFSRIQTNYQRTF